ncbi:MAG TPA: CheR family methyltransferase [Chloroflexota bacterium]
MTTSCADFLEEVRIQRGIDFNAYKRPTIRRRLQRRFAAVGVASLADYRAYVEGQPNELDHLIRSFLIKVTEFFRDEELFEYLQEHLLPQLILDARKRGNELRLWSAGCATGQESYSLAMLLAEVLGNELERFAIRVFATDLDPAAVAYARRGIYPPSAISEMPREMLERYFTVVEGEYEVKKRIRSLLVFGQHDLGQRAPFPNIDLALCRNVLMYFTPELQKRALQLFAFSLRDEGYLALGKAETISVLPEFFRSEDERLRIYRRQGDRTLIPGSLAGGSTARPGIATGTHSPAQVAQHQPRGKQASASLVEPTLDELSVGVVWVDRRYDIQSINPMARRLLEIYVPGEGQDLVHLVRVIEAAVLRSAIDTVFGTGQPAKIEQAAVPAPETGSTRYLDVSCYPGRMTAEDALENVVVIVSDSTATAEQRPGREAAAAEPGEDAAQLRQRLDQLTQTTRELRQSNEELLRTNQTLGASGEDLEVDHASVQAFSEELETLNEELHASNEELETLNEELQATVEELNATNDDLTARDAVLRELSERHDEQRARLHEMLDTMGDAVLVLNAEGQAILTNPAYQQLFGSDSASFVGELPDGSQIAAAVSPQQRAARGEEFTMEFTVTAADGTRRWLEAQSRALRDQGQSILVIRDMTDRSLRQMQNQFVATASHELRTPLTALKGHIDLAQRRLSEPGNVERLRNHLTISTQQVTRIERMVDELFDAQRLETGKLQLNLQPTDVVELVSRVVETQAHRSQCPTAAPSAVQGPRPRWPAGVLRQRRDRRRRHRAPRPRRKERCTRRRCLCGRDSRW